MSEESLDTKEVSQVVDKFENTNTGFLFFQKTRQNLNTLLNNCLESVKQFNKFDRQIESIESLLNHEDILYPSIQLPGTRDDYFSSLSRETRRYFRRYGKRFEEAGGEFETIKGNDITEKDVEDFLNLHAERWKDESAAVSNRTLNFHQELVNKLSKENRYSLFFAKYEGKRIASHACMDYGKYREAYFNGRDPEFEELRAGRLLYLETIMDAIDNDFETYNLGLGGDRYKLSFSNQVHTVSNILLMPGKKSIDLERVFPNYEYINI